MAGDGADIRELERQWRDALFAKDEGQLRKLIHPQFKLVGIRSTGTVAVGLEDWLVALQKMDLVSLEVRVMDSVRLDETMVATVDAQWKLRFMGHAIDERVLELLLVVGFGIARASRTDGPVPDFHGIHAAGHFDDRRRRFAGAEVLREALGVERR